MGSNPFLGRGCLGAWALVCGRRGGGGVVSGAGFCTRHALSVRGTQGQPPWCGGRPRERAIWHRAPAAATFILGAPSCGQPLEAAGAGWGVRAGLGYTKLPPVVGRLNVLQACRAVASGGRGREAGGRAVPRGGGGRLWRCFTVGGGVRNTAPPLLRFPTGGQPTACTLALRWLDFGSTKGG